MGSMKLWRHERQITADPSDSSKVILIDHLTFQPRMAKRFVRWFIRRVFLHRHEVIKANLSGAQKGTPADRFVSDEVRENVG
jgi:hypothetical protein